MGEQISDIVFEIDGSTLMVAEALWRGMADELQELHYLKGAQFINQLKLIIYYGEFHPVEGETNIYSAINENSGILGLYDLKTVHGKGSVGTQLLDSIGQTNRVLLNITTDYNPRVLAKDIRRYFERNANAIEVLIMKGTRTISVIRENTLSKSYIRNFMMKYKQK